MRAPLKKILIARYVLLLEIIGFVIMGIIIAGMAFCFIYKIDDSCKVKTESVTAKIEAVTLPARSYVRSVKARDGQKVKKGDALFSVFSNPDDVRILEVRDLLVKADQSLSSPTIQANGAQIMTQIVQQALAASKQVNPTGPATDVVAPTDGIVKIPDAAKLQDTLKTGTIANVNNFDALRFSFAVSGKNADRVNINLLGTEDILDWSALTKAIRSEAPPADPIQAYIWESISKDPALKAKLKFVQPGKTPTDESQTDIVNVLDGLLRKREFYNQKTWSTASALGEEARKLIAKGVGALTDKELFRLNRLLLQEGFADIIEKSPNRIQKIKTKILVPQESKVLANGQEQKQKPLIYYMTGTVLTDRDPSGNVTVELPSPDPKLKDYLEKRLGTPTLPAASMNGDIVVGQIRLFQFLFNK